MVNTPAAEGTDWAEERRPKGLMAKDWASVEEVKILHLWPYVDKENTFVFLVSALE